MTDDDGAGVEAEVEKVVARGVKRGSCDEARAARVAREKGDLGVDRWREERSKEVASLREAMRKKVWREKI